MNERLGKRKRNSHITGADITVLSAATFNRLNFDSYASTQLPSAPKVRERIHGLRRSLPRLINDQRLSYKQIAEMFCVSTTAVCHYKKQMEKEGYRFRRYSRAIFPLVSGTYAQYR